MKPFTFFHKKYALLVSLLFATGVSPSQIILGFSDLVSVAQGRTSGIIDAVRLNSNFSYQVADSSYKWNDSRSTLSTIYLNTSAIIKSADKPSSVDINGFNNGAWSKRISNEHLAHFMGSTYL